MHELVFFSKVKIITDVSMFNIQGGSAFLPEVSLSVPNCTAFCPKERNIVA
jgi:hypothetical protein